MKNQLVIATLGVIALIAGAGSTGNAATRSNTMNNQYRVEDKVRLSENLTPTQWGINLRDQERLQVKNRSSSGHGPWSVENKEGPNNWPPSEATRPDQMAMRDRDQRWDKDQRIIEQSSIGRWDRQAYVRSTEQLLSNEVNGQDKRC